MERWATIKRLHQAALDQAPAQRAAFLDEACAGDDALRREVESLLAYDTRAESFMESAALDVTARSVGQDVSLSLVGRTLGHYQVESVLGAGGMGDVYLARDPRLDRAVALKVLPPELAGDADRMERFAREAIAASALNHPNVATIYDIGESERVHFIAMEYVDGQTLAARLDRGALTAAEVLTVGVQVADALEAAHTRSITHRDIKPANLMLTPRGQVKVLDFGIAKTTGPPEGGHGVQDGRNVRLQPDQETSPRVATSPVTQAGTVLGSVPYMSPEQLLGREADHRSDIFSLGVTLYELMTGRHPFAGATATETTDRILHTTPARIAALMAAIPPELEHITFKCLEKDRARRYQSASELLTDLRQLQQTNANADRSRIPSADSQRHNLPAQLSSFVGRSKEMEEINRLLSTTRLLTLTGAGGCGKTRLALQVAAALVDRFPDGVWLADLAPLSDPDLVARSVAASLKVQEGSQRSLIEVLSASVRAKRLLLVLDNCEHLIAACATIAETLLRAGASVHVLATSREALGVAGETVWRVPSLSLPATAPVTAPEVLVDNESCRLFIERGVAVAPTFAITSDNAAGVAEICRRLDGIPLAIELAAARLNMLTPDQIKERLNDRFRLLTGGSRTSVGRQRTLEATVDWSYDLLSRTERRLLCRLSVFAGGWTLEAAEQVCSGEAIRKEAMLDLLSHLVDKSLVTTEEDAFGNRRYRFLETVRQYGRERLLRSREVQRLRDRHFAFFLDVVRRAEPELQGPHQVRWLKRLEGDHDNLRAALEWSSSTGPERADEDLELAGALFWFWMKHCYFSEGRQALERALAVDGPRSAKLRAKALVALAHMVFFSGDYARTLVLTGELMTLGRGMNDRWALAWALTLRAAVAINRVDASEQREKLASEALAASAQAEDQWLEGLCLMFLALDAEFRHDYEKADLLFNESLVRFRATGDKMANGLVLGNISGLRLLQGRHRDAKAAGAEAIGYHQELSDHRGAAWCLEMFASAAAAENDATRAARLWGASDRLLESVGSPLPGSFQWFRDSYYGVARALLGEDAFQRAVLEGRAMTLEETVKYALSEMTDVRQNAAKHSP